MVAFDRQVDISSDLAFRLVANTFVTLFWRLALFDETTDWLRTHGYDVVRLNASDWVEEADLHRELAAALEFPSYYGKNLDALNDCMRDVVTCDYGTSPEATGLVLAFTGYDRFAAHCPLPTRRPDRAGHHGWPGAERGIDRTPHDVPGSDGRPEHRIRPCRSHAGDVE